MLHNQHAELVSDNPPWKTNKFV